MTSNQENLKSQTWLYLTISFAIALFIIALPLTLFYFFYQKHFLPNTYVENTDLSHLNLDSAVNELQQSFFAPQADLVLNYQDLTSSASFSASIASPAANFNLHYDPKLFLQTEIQKQQSLNPFQLFSQAFLRLRQPLNIPRLPLLFDQAAIKQFVTDFTPLVSQVGTPAAITLEKTNQPKTLTFTQGMNDRQLNLDQTIANLTTNLSQENSVASASVELITYELNPSQTAQLEATASSLIGKSIVWTSPEINSFRFTFNDQTLISCLDPQSAIPNPDCLDQKLNEAHVLVDRQAVNPVFEYDPTTLKVTKFSPPVNGLTFDHQTALTQAQTGFQQLLATDSAQKTISYDLPVQISTPSKPLSATNNLGINERIGFGESYYYHSSAGRIYNVSHSAAIISGTLIAPGEEFSFNKRLGPVSAATGFKQAYIIASGRTVLGDGGGVCQVSSTLFRALLDSGLKITRRLPHAYRVSYYELNNDPGFDATVYSGNVDLRFINDTKHHILIYMETDPVNLYMKTEIYGTSDGRTTEIVDYIKYDATPAPGTIYTPDSSLAPGQTKFVEGAVGGLKTNFTNIIRDAQGNILRQDKYPSSYRAWPAQYLVGPTE